MFYILSNLKEIGFIKFHIKNLKSFDEITRVRLMTMGIAFFVMELFIPVVTEFKGKYLSLQAVRPPNLFVGI